MQIFVVLSFFRGLTVGKRGEGSVLGVLPFYHIYGMVVSLFTSLYEGNTVVTLPRFQPQPFLSAIQDHEVSKIQIHVGMFRDLHLDL